MSGRFTITPERLLSLAQHLEDLDAPIPAMQDVRRSYTDHTKDAAHILRLFARGQLEVCAGQVQGYFYDPESKTIWRVCGKTSDIG
jgi:hypothetical protein